MTVKNEIFNSKKETENEIKFLRLYLPPSSRWFLKMPLIVGYWSQQFKSRGWGGGEYLLTMKVVLLLKQRYIDRAFSGCLLRAIISHNHLPFFKVFSNFGHRLTFFKIFSNFVNFCPFFPFFGKIVCMSLLSRIGPDKYFTIFLYTVLEIRFYFIELIWLDFVLGRFWELQYFCVLCSYVPFYMKKMQSYI